MANCVVFVALIVLATRQIQLSSAVKGSGCKGHIPASGDSKSSEKSGTPNVDATYGNWSNWSKCTARCIQKRTGKCRNVDACGENTQTQDRPCAFGECRNGNPARIRHGISRTLQDIVFNMLYNEWSTWSMCTRSCKQRRFRTCAMKSWCDNVVIMEEKKCFQQGTNCEMLWREEAERDQQEIEDIDEGYTERNDRRNRKPKPKPKVTAVPPDPLTCGKRPAGPSPRIVGGYEARKGSWPWQVAITTKRGEQYCGGVLIAPQWIATAAHCVRKNGRKRRIRARAGDHDLMAFDETEVDMEVDTDFAHPDFNMDTIDSDIALVRLKEPVPESLNLQFACVPGAGDVVRTNTLCYAVGWGKIKETHRFGTDILREAPVPLVDDRKCQQAFDYDLTKSQMCAGYRRGGIDTCAGDSGGPLMCEIVQNGESRWFVYGITSFGEGCGDKGKYGIYTKLSLFSDWIKNITAMG